MKKIKISTIVLILIFLVGLSLLLYPTVSDYWNSLHQSQAIVEYSRRVEEMDGELYEKLWNEAIEYNRVLADRSDRFEMTRADRQEYESLLNVSGNGIMLCIHSACFILLQCRIVRLSVFCHCR